MDLNHSLNFTSSSNTSPQIQDFMPVDYVLPNCYPFQPTEEEVDEEARCSSFMELQENIELFWNQQLLEIHNTTVTKADHQLPLARVKRIMKSDGEVKLISSETPILFSKACELFIMELTLRSWLYTEGCKRRTLQRSDITRAIRDDELLDFLRAVADSFE